MKIVKTLLYILIIINSKAYSSDYVIESDANIWDKVPLAKDSKWALDGSIFQISNPEFHIKNNGNYTLLVLEESGELKTHNITIINGENNENILINTVVVDSKPPQLKYSWENVDYQGTQVVVGPKSQLNWQLDEPNTQVTVFINDQLSDLTNPIKITEQISKIVIDSTDEYQNKSETLIPFSSDFSGPKISWKLEPPSILHNNQWYANKSANLHFQSSDALAVWIDGQSIPIDLSVIKVNNNSELLAMDSLGNSTTETIKWLEDQLSPQLSVITLGQTYINPEKLKVKVGQEIIIQFRDEVVGVLSSDYYGNNREWLPIPNAFVFVDTGLYRLKLRSNDKIGNELITDIVFKITK